MPNRTKKENYRRGRQLVEIKRTVGDKRRSFYGKTKEDAIKAYEDAKKKYIEERALISHGILPESDITFKDWAGKWLAIYKKGMVRDVTYSYTYDSPTRKHLIPYFGAARLKDIRPSDIMAFMATIRNMSFSSQNKCLICLRGIFETAVDNDLIQKNPAKNVRPSKLSSDVTTKKRAYTYDQARVVIEFAKTHKYGVDIICLLKGGLRVAELLALPFVCSPDNGGVDMENNIFCVRQSVSESSSGASISPCKSAKSRRDIPFDHEMAEIIKNVPAGIYYTKPDTEYARKYLICNKYGGYMLPSNWRSRRFYVFKKDFEAYAAKNKYDIPMLNPHELRHSFGSILYSRGVDIVTISKLMGHASIEITVRLYVHDDLKMKQDAIAHGV